MLYGYKFVANVLQPLQVVVWGELALGYLGVPTVLNDYMFGVSDEELDMAEHKLISAGFVRQTWSFCSTRDPENMKNHPRWQQWYANKRTAYQNFDSVTRRFDYPDESRHVTRTILLPTSYLRLSISDPGQAGYADPTPSLSQPAFYIDANLHWPNVVMLLQSILMVIEEESYAPRLDFVGLLKAWAFTYLVNDLSLRHDVLDSCRDATLKEYFDKKTNRGQPQPIREKWNKPRPLITNERIREFQVVQS
ncbi:hypothetical protein GLAREA_12086 [Glarea lozoyensis ATCC 20868]|uniref:Uncharacterized protein n=1 Tax=Glarea lozoyensis (strain ATCC 20868 / MF5171) TaxID=1116229 RepID=S3D4G0_GLAL2|nr:uncharacterized protein GLAREA_12086 [Glarea lozoyensis ATCC 20868]EPE32004.1 hypothetical protein GLAREA_12086 [Glarea lozoyensis ATCC 20868]